MKTRLLIISLLVLISAGNLFALTVEVTFDNGGVIDTALKAPVEAAISTEIAKFSNMPDLAKGFGNAATYASGAATLRGYQGYDLFAISAGSMLSLQAPSGDPLFFMDLKSDLDKGDVYAGVGGNPAVVEGGLNLSFLIDGLYMSFKFGKVNYRTGDSIGVGRFKYKTGGEKYGIEYESNLFGVLANYMIIQEKAILSRILLWRGISLQSGFIYSNSIISYYKKLSTQTITNGGYTADVDSSIDLVLDTKTFVIPVELYTSIRLLYILNIGVGGGVDFVPYGRTSFNIKSAGTITVTAPVPVAGTLGSTNIDASTKDVKPDYYRPKFMTNLGLGVGPVFIDMPLTYYFTDNGYAVGISAGMVW